MAKIAYFSIINPDSFSPRIKYRPNYFLSFVIEIILKVIH